MRNKIDKTVTDKVKTCKERLIKTYFNSSIIEKIVNTYDAEKTKISNNFLKLGHWKYIPYHFFTDPATFPDPIFSQYGSSIALGETKYLVNKILSDERININSVDNLDIDLLSSITREFRITHSLYELIILFMPIEYFMKIHVDWLRSSNKILMEKGQFYISGFPVKIYWSNKYNQFKDVIIYDKSFASWYCKPTVRDRLHITLNRSKESPSNMELRAEIIFKLNIDEPNLVSIIRPKFLPNKDRN